MTETEMNPTTAATTPPVPKAADTVEPAEQRAPKMRAIDISVFYGDKQALNDVSIDIYDDRVTAFIGPSGCGKSTFLRCLNRMNVDLPHPEGPMKAVTKFFRISRDTPSSASAPP